VTPGAERWLRRGALALSLTLVTSVTATGAVVMWPRVARVVGVTPPPPEPAYRAGQTIDTPGDWTSRADVTVVLFAQSACGACQSAKPFLRKLFAETRARGAAVVVSSHGPDRSHEAAYTRELDLPADALHQTPAGLRVRATPTLVVVNRAGQILDAWEGVGPEPQQLAILKAVLAKL
jgi:hypothetical protein